jgi:hypothetical protein
VAVTVSSSRLRDRQVSFTMMPVSTVQPAIPAKKKFNSRPAAPILYCASARMRHSKAREGGRPGRFGAGETPALPGTETTLLLPRSAY